ncbi:MAG TPA: RNA polymerase sigma factor [Polyangiaceae bacterium]|nr:RNA polymerase sigma factor [Polyangiaceae bacterium]
MTREDDHEALALLRRRDPRGLDLAFSSYAGPLLGFLRRLSGQSPLAEDLLQEVFVRLAEHGPNLRRDSDLRAWLYAVARNAYLSQARRAPLAHDDPMLEGLVNPAPELEARLLLGDVERALAELRLEDREVLLLVAVEELERDEIARLLGVDAVALRQRLARARSRLLAELSRQTGGGDTHQRKTGR